MSAVTDVDRKAAEELRAILADLSGFWFNPGDTGPLCTALARHRETSELKLLEKISHSSVRAHPSERMPSDIPVGYENRAQRQRAVAVIR
jgi:hypothetical protein